MSNRAKQIKQINCFAFAPLLNFTLDIDEVKLSEGNKIRRATKKEREIINQFSNRYAISKWGKWDFVICTNDKLIETQFLIPLYHELVDISRVLKLFKNGFFSLGPQFIIDKDKMACISFGGYKDITDFTFREKYQYKLLSSETNNLQQLQKKYNKINLSKNKRLNTALTRFDKSYDEGLNTKPIDIMIAFEALFLSEEQELSYKLANRIAYLIADNAEQRIYISYLMRKAYALRSKIVHGGDIPRIIEITKERAFKPDEFMLEVENILRDSIKKIIDLLSKYSHGKLLLNLLDENILSGGIILKT